MMHRMQDEELKKLVTLVVLSNLGPEPEASDLDKTATVG